GSDTTGIYCSGNTESSSASQAFAFPSLGARQSPRGESDPMGDTFGPFGMAERLNWANPKNRFRKSLSHVVIASRSYSGREPSGKPAGQAPRLASDHACRARNATFDGRWPYRSTCASVK